MAASDYRNKPYKQYLSDEMYEALRQIKVQYNTPRQVVVRRALQYYLKAAYNMEVKDDNG